MPPAVVAGVTVAGSIGGALISSNASESAASTQAAAADAASATELAMYNQTRDDLMPYQELGNAAIADMAANRDYFNDDFTFGDFLKSEDYQGMFGFGMQEGTKALDRTAAATGGALGGAASKALTRYGTDYTNAAFGDVWNRYNTDRTNRYNRLYNLIGVGENAAAQTGNVGSLAAQGVASNTIGAGNAIAAGTVGSANAISGAIGTATNTWMDYANQQNNINTAINNSYASGAGTIF